MNRRSRNFHSKRSVGRISIIVPAYNEQGNIPILAEKMDEMFKKSRLKGEVILVDDGSSDNTFGEIREASQRYRFIRIMRHKTNRGLTAALETGFNAARGRILMFWPADLQYMPEEIPKLVAKIEEGYHIVCGWRQGHYGMKRFVSWVYNGLSRMLFRVPIHDFNSVKAFRREVIEELPVLREGWHRYLVVIASQKGYKVGEVKVRLYPRKIGKSKFGFWRIPIGVTDLFSVKFQVSFMRKPLLFFGSIGFILLGIGFFVGLGSLYLRFMLHEGYRPLLYLVMLLVTLGMALFMLGFLAEAMIVLQDEISSLRREVRRASEKLDSVNNRNRQLKSMVKKKQPGGKSGGGKPGGGKPGGSGKNQKDDKKSKND
ncbi:MAG: glycosyltransferase [candidate division Zixibacteria bacterium]|nr:glycosyltransferase [candidate division Zixibacteria bacterium]